MDDLQKIFEDQNKNILFEENNKKDTIGIVSFQLGTEIFGIEIKYILEIINIVNVTNLYRLPDYLIGITNLRGQIKPVINLKKFLKINSEFFSENEEENELKGLLISNKEHDAILTVDRICNVEWIEQDRIRDIPDTTPENLKEFTSNLIYTDEKPIVLISGLKILTSSVWEELNA